MLTESSPLMGWNTLETVVTHLEQLTSSVESDWAQSALARVESEDDIGMSPLNSLLPLMLHTRILQHLSLARL